MTVPEIKRWIEEIVARAGDDEAQHSREDTLHQKVLQAIANGASEPRLLAQAALKTRKIIFERWCA